MLLREALLLGRLLLLRCALLAHVCKVLTELVCRYMSEQSQEERMRVS